MYRIHDDENDASQGVPSPASAAWALPPALLGVGLSASVAALPPALEGLRAALPPALLEPRGLVGLLGLLLLLAGSRFYRVAIIAPGFAGGVYLAQRFLSGLADPLPLVFGLLLGAGGALACHVAERVAVRLVGSLLITGLVYAVTPLIFDKSVPFWWAPAAGLVGLFLVPRLYERALPVIGAIMGALAVAWSMDRPQDLGLIGVLAAGGLVIQLVWRAVRGEPKGRSKAKPKGKPKAERDEG
jgi:hypothetical protein